MSSPPKQRTHGYDRQALINGPIPSTLLRFALPVIAGSALQSLNGVVNAIWVSHILGLNALAATSNANQIFFLLLSSSIGVGLASNIYVAQAVGADNLSELKRVVGTATSFFLGISVTVAVVGFLFAPGILTLMTTPPEVKAQATIYLRLMFAATPFLYVMMFVTMIQRGIGDSRTPLKFTTAAVLLDIVFNPLLMHGFGPLPALGIAGSALSTVLAQALSLGAMLFYLYRRESPLLLRPGEFHYLKPHGRTLWLLISKGVPMSLQMLIMSATGVVVITLVNRYGARTTAAFGAASNLWSYIQMPAIGISAAVSSMNAQNVGAGRWDRVSRITLTAVAYGLVLTAVATFVIYLGGDPLMSFFLPHDPEAVAIAHRINGIVLWALVLFSTTFILFGAVRATGAVVAPLMILMLSLWFVRLPFATMLMPHYGADAIWWSFPLSAVVSNVCAILYYRFGGWRNARMLPMTRKPAPASN